MNQEPDAATCESGEKCLHPNVCRAQGTDFCLRQHNRDRQRKKARKKPAPPKEE